MVWYYESIGQPMGPISQEAIELLVRDGLILRSTLVWKQGMSNWAPADQTELLGLFSTPPPLEPSRTTLAEAPESNQVIPVSRSNNAPDVAASQKELSEVSSSKVLSAELVAPAEPDPPKKTSSEEISIAINSLSGIAKHANIIIILYVIVSAAAILSDFISIDFINAAMSGDRFQSDFELNQQADFVDNLSLYSDFAFLIVFAWSGIVIGRWTYRSMKNLRAMGYDTTVSPGWAVGWHFIPVALLWMPFRAMAQIWRGSIDGTPTGDATLPGSMRIWWACWVLGNGISFSAFQMQESGLAIDDFEQVKLGLGAEMLSSAMHIISALLLMSIIKRVTAAQQENRSSVFD